MQKGCCVVYLILNRKLKSRREVVEVWFYSADNVANHQEVTNIILVGSRAGLVRWGNKIVNTNCREAS